MITTSSKLFYGLGAGSLVGAVLWMISGNSALGAVALFFLATALLFAGSIASFVRDGHVLSTDTAAHATAAATNRSPRASLWPLGTAVSVGVLVVGLISSPGIFKVGVALTLAMLGEWMIQNWSERGSADAAYNTKIRDYMVHPLELPVAGALLLAVIVLSFSRLMLALDKSAGTLVFAFVSAIVLAVGAVIAVRRNVSRRIVGAMSAVVLVALAGAGVATALDGEREQLVEYSAEDPYRDRGCTAEKAYSDKKASRSVAAKSNILATVTLRDGQLIAEVAGYSEPQSELYIQRANPSTILFVNESDEARRMVLSYGKVVEDLGDGVERETLLQSCTSKVEKGGQQSVTVRIPQPSFASDEPFSITVPGVSSARLSVVVP
ncbi:MAG: hypothetical protein O3C62_10330 [Actinomycetota bacterium]|nr:hypothetical protein [Actinomycetota bacterium]MDA2972700.1 hypothetical protein [Actinomycetota bacterium]MDA3002064.1 hypothetical protein [Actinomycetota bacterium]